jgi:hypothetical protein
MIRFITKSVLLLAIAVAVPAPAFAQGTQYGTIRGTVTLPDGTPAGGVLVTAVSPAQPGERTALTTGTGEYILRNLLPGEYVIVFELEGLNPHQSPATVSLGQVTPVDVTMEPRVVEGETIHVTGERPSVLANSEVSTTYTAEQVDKLPIGRTPADIANLAPGLTDNTPNDDQVTISGAFAYDNIFLIDGVDANDNLFGDVNFVYIEDAIADTQVLTSGISAEYGRFSGGVINIVTKSGGNEFSGSFRADLTNEDWREQTPVEEEQGSELIDDVNQIYSATLGGYVLKDQIWFFAAGRDEETSQQDTLAQTGTPVIESVTEERYELKGTWNIGNRHQVQGQYTDRDAEGIRPSFDFSATLNTLRSRRDPNWLRVARYNGALTNSLFAEAQWSEKHFGFRNDHGNEGLVESSPFFALLGVTPDGAIVNTPDLHFHAPYFDGTDPEDRDNEQIYGAASWFADTAGLGSHDLKVGYEDFTSTRVGGNSQSPTNFVWDTLALIDESGDYIVDADGDLIPVFIPGITYVELWIPNRGATIDIQTQSAFANDRWRFNDHWSFNLGFRYEEVQGDATGGIVTVDTDRFVPRLGASYDVRGDGKYRFDATYAQYSGKYSESQFAENTTVGVPRGVFLDYVGPECTGFDCAEAFDIENNYVPFDASDGTANIIMANDIQSPVVTEFTLAGGTELGRGGYLKAIYTNREYDDFVEDFTCAAAAGVPCPGPGDTGTTFVVVEGVEVGFANNKVFDNSGDPSREYEAIQLIGRYVLTDRWDVNGHWTYQLTNEGNFEGENTNQPGISSFFGDFPGYFVADRHFPTGRLNDFQEHKIRLWSTYNFDLGRAGSLATTLLANHDSGTTYSLQGSLPRGFTALQQQILEAYDSAPASTQLVFFGERGTGEFASATYFDLGLLYSLPVVNRWGVEVFVKADVFNVLDEDKAIQFNTNVAVDADGPVDANGLPTDFIRGAAFGNPEDNEDFLEPREYQFGVGLRF